MSSKNHHQRCASCYYKLAGRGTLLIFFLSIGGDARCSVVNAGFGQSHAREKRGSKKCTAMRSAGSSRGRELAHGDGLAGKDRADANPGPDLHVLLIPHSLFIIITTSDTSFIGHCTTNSTSLFNLQNGRTQSGRRCCSEAAYSLRTISHPITHRRPVIARHSRALKSQRRVEMFRPPLHTCFRHCWSAKSNLWYFKKATSDTRLRGGYQPF
jgi:hypothetical protein